MLFSRYRHFSHYGHLVFTVNHGYIERHMAMICDSPTQRLAN